jgi:hypothetical protein
VLVRCCKLGSGYFFCLLKWGIVTLDRFCIGGMSKPTVHCLLILYNITTTGMQCFCIGTELCCLASLVTTTTPTVVHHVVFMQCNLLLAPICWTYKSMMPASPNSRSDVIFCIYNYACYINFWFLMLMLHVIITTMKQTKILSLRAQGRACSTSWSSTWFTCSA